MRLDKSCVYFLKFENARNKYKLRTVLHPLRVLWRSSNRCRDESNEETCRILEMWVDVTFSPVYERPVRVRDYLEIAE